MSDPDSSDRPRRSGQVRHDAGGRAIWEWAIESGRHAIDSTSRLLKKLELTGITLMRDDAKPWERDASGTPDKRSREPDAAERTAPQPLPTLEPEDGNKGFNPYDTRTPVGRGAPAVKKPSAPRPRITQPPARKRGFFARLFGRR